ncbi:MAG: tRNA 2-thiouridine(34) synthase MnmA [Clostridia bacterium]|nr:tRNA 2-thiouridine(34) synthase MnmA [Clostridia bacterium]MBQ7090113.1 tRNA 2-thiouridine(34) synthase MnmA [Clostridia bacterium]
MTKVAVGLSGGVDSAVCVLLLRQAGYEPHGVFLKMHRVGNEEEAARRAAEELQIPFYMKDMTAVFEAKVMQPFAALYKKGETPNPCILCNPAVKFRGLLEAAEELGCEKIATGHYARVERYADRFLVRRLEHSAKDQSYMLYGLGQEVLSRLLLPIGEMADKAQVRRLAEEHGLSASQKKDSQDICFLEPGSSHEEFIARYAGSPPEKGEITDPAGKVLGSHNGICCYTVGQRRGLGVAATERLYVAELDAKTNRVVLGPKESVETKTVTLRNAVLHLPLPADGLTAKVRYRDRDTAVRVELQGEDSLILHFEESKFAAAPGQSAVIYWKNYVLGGGFIEKMIKKV